MEEFTDLLERYLAAREAVKVDHGPLWDEYQSAKRQLDQLFRKLMEESWYI